LLLFQSNQGNLFNYFRYKIKELDLLASSSPVAETKVEAKVEAKKPAKEEPKKKEEPKVEE
jgi:hypothetical protein